MTPCLGHIARIISIILVTCFAAKGQSFNPKYNFKQLNVQNGLPQNLVYHFLHDSRGYMWIGTHNGLTLYDGVKTINFQHKEQDSSSLAGNFISSILEDSAHQLWIGNEMGIDRYNRDSHTFSHYGVDRPDGSKDDTYCVAMGFVSASNLWFLDTKTRSIRSLNTKTGSTSFVAEINAYHATFYKSPVSQSIHIWSTYDKGTIHQVFKENKLVSQQLFFTGKNDNPAEPVMDVIHALQQNDTVAWLSTNKGLVKMNPVLGKYTLLNNWNGQEVRELRYGAISPGGQLWLGSGPGGVYVFDINTNQFVANYRNDKLDPFSICSDNIVSLYFDRAGHVWCGSWGSGGSYTNIENKFFSSHLSKKEMQTWHGDNNISWLNYDRQGNLWFMVPNVQGFWTVDKDFKVTSHKNTLIEGGAYFNNGISKLLFDTDGNIWCATNIGLYLYDAQAGKMKPVKYPLLNEENQGSIWMRDIFQLNDKSIIFSTFVGLYRLTKGSGKFVIEPINFLPKGEYLGFGGLFQDDKNYVYVKSLGNMLYILKPGQNGKPFELLKSITFNLQVNHYFNEKGDSVIYMATSNGLYRINNKNFQIEREDFGNKLPFENVSSVIKRGSKFWVFGVKGLYCYDEKIKTGRIFTIEDGLPAHEFNASVIVSSPSNMLVAGTSNGLVSFFPDRQQDTTYAPRPQLNNIYVNDVLYQSDRNPNETKRISLSYKENTFSFDFSPIAFQHAGECSFEFKLQGYDENWLTSGPAHYTRYSKIPPGNYLFQLRAVDAMGNTSPILKTVEIEIAKAFWQTNLFRAAILLFIALIAWLFFKWYFNYKISKQKLEFEKQQAIEKERTRIATDMHDDLGAGLSRIRFLSQALTNKRPTDDSVKAGLEKITSYSDEMTEKMGEIVWALNEKNDTLADLVAYTRSYAVEYLANKNISCQANTPLDLPGNFIPGEIRRNIFLSVKECLHNIVKHANASSVCLSVHFNNMIEIIIHDNGKGIDWNNLRAYGNGLKNIQKRMQDIGGTVEFINDSGTKVLFQVPFTI